MKASIFNLSDLMRLAWQFVKENGFTMSEALKVAWSNFYLKNLLKSSKVRFFYYKIDGTIREAYGTLSDKIIPSSGEVKRKKNDSLQTYFDIEVNGWRSFRKANLISL